MRVYFERQPMTFERSITAIVGLLSGTIFLAGAAWVPQRDRNERLFWQQTDGIVVDTVSRRERNYDEDTYETKYASVIEFEANGDRVRFIGSYSTSRASQGNVVTVRYDPSQPSQARVVDPFEWLSFWFAVGMGGSALVMGVKAASPVRLRRMASVTEGTK